MVAYVSQGIAGTVNEVNVQSFGLIMKLFSSRGGALFVEVYEEKIIVLFLDDIQANLTRYSRRCRVTNRSSSVSCLLNPTDSLGRC